MDTLHGEPSSAAARYRGRAAAVASTGPLESPADPSLAAATASSPATDVGSPVLSEPCELPIENASLASAPDHLRGSAAAADANLGDDAAAGVVEVSIVNPNVDCAADYRQRTCGNDDRNVHVRCAPEGTATVVAQRATWAELMDLVAVEASPRAFVYVARLRGRVAFGRCRTLAGKPVISLADIAPEDCDPAHCADPAAYVTVDTPVVMGVARGVFRPALDVPVLQLAAAPELPDGAWFCLPPDPSALACTECPATFHRTDLE